MTENTSHLKEEFDYIGPYENKFPDGDSYVNRKYISLKYSNPTLNIEQLNNCSSNNDHLSFTSWGSRSLKKPYSQNETSSPKTNGFGNDFACPRYSNSIESIQHVPRNKTDLPHTFTKYVPGVSIDIASYNLSLCSNTTILSGEAKSTLTREEIVACRRLKVSERRKMKKLAKQQLKEIVSGVQVAKPDFSLEQAEEDFPALNSTKRTKKNIKPNISTDTGENLFLGCNKPVEKSWKPKIKDPIFIDVSEVLQTSHGLEKSKPVVKRVNSTRQNISIGNILDSDNPQQNKGKVRPDKVKKLSKLKEQILMERSERRKKFASDTQDKSAEQSDNTVRLSKTEEEEYLPIDSVLSTLIENYCSVESDETPNPVKEAGNADNKRDDNVSNITKNIHSRKFREYCTNCLTVDLVSSVCSLLDKVAQFQDRMFALNPIKANAKRRYVAGLNQTNKYLCVKKVKMLIIAPDLEKNPGKGGLDERICRLIKDAKSQDVPCVFGPNRKRLGKCVFKHALVSCVAVLSYEGAEKQFAEAMEYLDEAKSQYEHLTGRYKENDLEKTENTSLAVKKDATTNEEASTIILSEESEWLKAKIYELGNINIYNCRNGKVYEPGKYGPR